MARVKRGTGRDALVAATAEVLLTGGDVQVKEVAAQAGVSHTLIYRHFPDGGKEELIAEAYATIFLGLTRDDVERMVDVIAEGTDVRERLRTLARSILDPRRASRRAARLEALSQIRRNPYVEERIDAMRKDLIQQVALRIIAVNPRIDLARARVISMIAQSIPLGISAIGDARLSRAERDGIAELWADSILAWLWDRESTG